MQSIVFMAHVIAGQRAHAKPLVSRPCPAHSAGMDRTSINDICRRFPGAEHSDPWGGGHDAWKVGGKMFACIGSMGGGVSVKTPDVETAQMLIEVGAAERALYFHKSWVFLPWVTSGADMRHRLETSYDLIRTRLTKKAQAALPPRS